MRRVSRQIAWRFFFFLRFHFEPRSGMSSWSTIHDTAERLALKLATGGQRSPWSPPRPRSTRHWGDPPRRHGPGRWAPPGRGRRGPAHRRRIRVDHRCRRALRERCVPEDVARLVRVEAAQSAGAPSATTPDPLRLGQRRHHGEVSTRTVTPARSVSGPWPGFGGTRWRPRHRQAERAMDVQAPVDGPWPRP